MSTTQSLALGGGCFWCTEAVYVKVRGVTDVESGYSNGQKQRPSYEDVCTGTTGHAEVVQITYDPAKISYEKLLQIFWLNHDPTVKEGQFCDYGSQYRPAIFYHSPQQKRLAEASKARWQKDKPFRQPIVTEISPAGEFWPAEDYHQNYYKKNALQYRFYVTGCGRYARLDQLWGALRGK